MKISEIPFNPATPYSYDQDMDLKNYSIVNIGIIMNINVGGITGTVQGFNISNENVELYENVELLYPGGLTTDLVGQPCLLVGTPLTITSVRNQSVNRATAPYDARSIKAIPLRFNQTSLNVGFNKDSFVISDTGGKYKCQFTASGISFEQGSNIYFSSGEDSIVLKLVDYQIVWKDDGTSDILYMHNNKIVSLKQYTSTGVIKQYYGAKQELTDDELDGAQEFKAWSWIKEINPDGSLSVQQLDAEQNIINQGSIDATGLVTWTAGKEDATPITLTAQQDGVVKITNTKGTAGIDAKGVITVTNTKGTITIDADGNINLSGKGNITLNAGGKVNLGNGTSLLDILNGLYDALSALQTKGSPAAQAADPTWVQSQLGEWQSTYQGVLS